MFRHPVQRVEGNNQIEFVPVGQLANVGDLEPEVGVRGDREMTRREGNHVARWVHAEHRAARHTLGNRGRNLSIAATDVENPLRAAERQQAKLLLGHRLLQGRLPVVIGRQPLVHRFFPH